MAAVIPELNFCVNSVTRKTGTNIQDYDNFVTQQVDADPTLAALGATWTAVASTSGSAASQASSTSNIPIFSTQGIELEPNFPTLFTDPAFSGPPLDQYGVPPSFLTVGFYTTAVWTGNTTQGDFPLGASGPGVGVDLTSGAWLTSSLRFSSSSILPLYAISSPITIGSAWAAAVSGSWSKAGNWTGAVPNASGAVAVINVSTTTALTVTVDAPQTLGTLFLGNSGAAGVGYTLSGAGSNTLTLNNSGNGATITVTNGTHAINAPVLLADNLMVTSGGTTSWALSFGTAASITDNGAGYSLTMSGTGGTLILSGTNTYGGGTKVTAGILTFLKTAAQPSSGTTTVAAGATLGLGVATYGAPYYSRSDVDNLFAGTMPNVSNDPNSNVGIDTKAGNFAYASNIPTTTRGLTKLGPNTLTLTGSNSYTGPTTVSGGTLQLGDGTSGHDPSLRTSGITDNSALVYNVAVSQTADYPISGTGTLTKYGTGTLTLGAPNSYAGSTVINQGTLKMQSAPGGITLPGNFAANGTVVNGYQDFFTGTTLNSGWTTNEPGIFSVSGGALHVNGTGTDPCHLLYEPAGLSPSGNWDVVALVELPNSTSIINNSRAGICAAGNLGSGAAGAAYDEVFLGGYENVQLLDDFAAVGPSVGPAWSTGTNYWVDLSVTSGNSVSAKFWPANDVTTEASAVTTTWSYNNLSGFAGITGPSGYLTSMDVYYVLIENSQLPSITVGWTPPGAVPPTTTMVIASGATWDINGSRPTVAGLSDVNPGSGGNVINSGASASVLTLSPTGGSSTFSGAIQGAIGLVMNGPGTQVLAGSNTYTGGTTIVQGTLDFLSQAALPRSASGPVSVANGATLGVGVGAGSNYFTSQDLDNLFGVSGTPEPNITMGTASIVGIDTTAAVLGFTYTSSLPASGMGLTKLGGNTLILTGSNLYTGPTTVSGGTLQLGDGTPGNDGSVAGNIVNNAALVFKLSGSQEYNGVINGSGSLTKVGIGTLTLGAVCSYGGPTIISGGTLKLQGVGNGYISTAAFTSDANSGISSANSYTEALAFAQGASLSINGVTFANANNTGGTGNLGSSWTITPAIAQGWRALCVILAK
jgi:autotransporter-associated beta strand protein